MPTVIGSRPRGGSHDPICGDTLPACATLVSRIDAAVPAWPQFRGPNSTGVAAPGGNPPVSFGPSENLVWKTPLPSGHSSPCIWGDLVFLTGYYPQSASFAVFALNRHSGAVEWQREIAVDEVEKVHATRPQRWQDAVRTLLELQDEYQAWLDNLPDNLTESVLAHKLEAICMLDLAELQSIEPPRGFGRD